MNKYEVCLSETCRKKRQVELLLVFFVINRKGPAKPLKIVEMMIIYLASV